MKYVVRFFLVAALIAPVASALSDSAPCPYDGDSAQKIEEVEIHDPSCPGDVYNAAKATYSHNHINGPFLERHTFSLTECLK